MYPLKESYLSMDRSPSTSISRWTAYDLVMVWGIFGALATMSIRSRRTKNIRKLNEAGQGGLQHGCRQKAQDEPFTLLGVLPNLLNLKGDTTRVERSSHIGCRRLHACV